MPLFGGISAGIALLGMGLSAAQYAKAQKDKKRADAAVQKDLAARPNYSTPQAVKDQLAEAQSRNGAVNPAIQIAQQQAQQQQANQIGAAQRNASSGTQALSAAAEATANANSILPNLVQYQTGYDAQNRQELAGARGAAIDDSRIQQQDMINRNQESANYNLGRVGAAQNDKSQALGLGLAALQTGVSAYGAYGRPNTGTTLPVSTDPRVATAVPTGLNPVAGGMSVPTAGQMPANLPANMQPVNGQFSPYQLAYLKKLGYFQPAAI